MPGEKPPFDEIVHSYCYLGIRYFKCSFIYIRVYVSFLIFRNTKKKPLPRR
jgi:hypothetical protein